jgi:ComEC/Rec2-related protein
MRRCGDKSIKTSVAEERLFNFRPMAFAAAFLCLGIAFGYYVYIESVSPWWGAFAFALPTCALFFVKNKRSCVLALLLLYLALAFGFTSFLMVMRRYDSAQSFIGEKTVIGRVVNKSETGFGCKIELTDLYVDEKAVEGRLIAYLPLSFYEETSLSDVLVVRGEVEKLSAFGEFGFRAGEIADGIKYQISDAQNAVNTGNEQDLLLALRSRMEQVTFAGMDESAATVTFGVLTGDTSRMEKALKDNVRYGGIAHIFAVSGMHIGALYAFARLLTDKTFLKRLPTWAKFALTAGILLFYGGVCGFSASVIRAIVLCLVSYFRSVLRITYDGLETLGVAALVVLALYPTLFFDVGFRLSFGACFGIATVKRPIFTFLDGAGTRLIYLCTGKRQGIAEREWRIQRADRPLTITERAVRSCNSFLSVSLSAQLATAPILVASYGYLSGWGLLLNCFYVPFLGVAFAPTLVTVLLACIIPAAAGVILYVPNVVWLTAILPFETADFASGALGGFQIAWQVAAAWYLWLILLSDKINLKGWLRTVCVYSAFFLFVVLFILVNL